MQAWAKSFYNSKAWQRCREAYIQKRMHIDGGVCEVCRREQGYIVHHIIPLTKENISNPLIALDHGNMRYECKGCHDEEEGHYYDAKGKKTKRLLCVFDDNGQICADLRKNI